MLSKKAIKYFVLRAALVYSIFLFLSWMGLSGFYGVQFRNAGNSLATVGRYFDLNVEFKENNKADRSSFDTEIIIMDQLTLDSAISNARRQAKVNEIQVPSVTMALNTSRQGFIPVILLLSLIFATPIPFLWRKVAAISWGLLLVHLYIIFRMMIWITYRCNEIDFLYFSIAESPMALNVLNFLYLSFSGDMPLRYIVPVIFWVIVSFRKKDFKSLFSGKLRKAHSE